ncbi:YtxH domain-containing protein, partial [Candidatus Nomurabacteria bacterium]|nr:YtxH domain-containing protein [Candidatus Nomurabacteria bacterium]
MSIRDVLENNKKAKKKAQTKKTAKNVAIGLGVGAAAGAAAGLLFAPKSGKETRKDISKGAKKVVEAAKDKA